MRSLVEKGEVLGWTRLNLSSIGIIVRSISIFSEDKCRSDMNQVSQYPCHYAILSSIVLTISFPVRYPTVPISSAVMIHVTSWKWRDSLWDISPLITPTPIVPRFPCPPQHQSQPLWPTVTLRLDPRGPLIFYDMRPVPLPQLDLKMTPSFIYTTCRRTGGMSVVPIPMSILSTTSTVLTESICDL